MMRRFVLLVIVMAAGCSGEDPVVVVEPYNGPIPASMKGYEMYSWEEAGTWKFTLITGTNRTKTYQEITAPNDTVHDGWVKVTVRDVPAVKELLGRVPAETWITWISNAMRAPGFSMPSQPVVDDIQAHCVSLNLHLQVHE